MRVFAFLFALVALPLASGCTVSSVYVHPDYEATYKQSVKRIGVRVVVPVGTNEAVGQLAATLVRRYVNQKRDYLVLRARVDAPSALTRTTRFGKDMAEQTDDPLHKGLDGILWFRLEQLRVQGDEVAASLHAWLLARKRTPELLELTSVWSAEAALTEDAAHEDLARLTARYVREFGPEVEPYVAPLFILTKRVVDTMPNPVLTDEDVMDKIELED